MAEVVERMMKPAESADDTEKEEESAPAASQPSVSPSQSVSVTAPKDSAKGIQPAPKKGSVQDIKGKPEESPPAEEAEVVKEEVKPKFKENDYMNKAQKPVPQDPDGNETMHKDLIVSADKVKDILEQTMLKTLTWLLAEKQNYAQKVATEGKELQDKSVEELDENLRKQWPRKGRLEVEVYQERKS